MKIFIVFALSVCIAGCASTSKTLEQPLNAPAGTVATATKALEEGNRMFAMRDWQGAKAQYYTAVKAQPSLAEAHYNLGLVLDVLREDEEARRHFMEAATLAPGHKVIWNSPPLRQHGDVDAHPKGGAMVTPAMGVH